MAEKVRLADRELKDRWGILAYSIAGLTASKNISVGDGLLDMIVVRAASVGSLAAFGAEAVGHGLQSDGVQMWQGREIQIECDPPQTVQGDGEIFGEIPVAARALPGVLPVLVPYT